MKNIFSIQSRIGGRTENQDYYGLIQNEFGDLFVVCDGMGGYSDGRIAAEIVVNIVLEAFQNASGLNYSGIIIDALRSANSYIQQYKKGSRMGSTVAALLLTPKYAISFHVGDSRVYQLRSKNVIFRTFDHSHVFELVKAGILTEEQARVSGKSNIITRAIGVDDTVEIDVSAELTINKGDRFLLCTDGVWNAVPEHELIADACKESAVEVSLTNLMNRIDGIGFAKGGKHDNLTAFLIEV